MDSTNPYSANCNFVDLLTRQQPNVIHEPFPYELGSSQLGEDRPPEHRERKKWTPSDDLILISSWLNTSKDPVVANEKKADAFWKRIAAYFAASLNIQSGDKPEPIQCKQRWQKINDMVCKFSGSYEAATRQKTSGQNENDVVNLAHSIFSHDHKMKFNLQHAWEELRHDQKWCEQATSKIEGSSKKRRCEDGADSSSSQASRGEQRPPGVKASKRAGGKRSIVDEKAFSDFQNMWAIKEKDLAQKEKLKKLGLLDTLIAKKEPLSEFEKALKKQLITEMLGGPE